MVAVAAAPKLTVQTETIATHTIAMRSLDWDRHRFDIEFEIKNGTTYNSFLIQGDKVALIDTSHGKFRELYLATLTGLIDPSRIDYLVVSHTEPDHSGLIRDLLALAPQITIVATKVAIQFLENLVHTPFAAKIVKSGDQLDLGQGHSLEFVSAPNLHWPDTMLTYDHATGVLYTCDVFGAHYCDDCLYDDYPELLLADYKLYYDCLMGPNARSVLGALKRMDSLPTIEQIATGHGPLLKHSIPDWLDKYRRWSEHNAKSEKVVAIFYEADYGEADRLANAIAMGIDKTGVAVELVDLAHVDASEVREWSLQADAVVIGMPCQSGLHAAHTKAMVDTILAAMHPKQTFGLFESAGHDDRSIYLLRNGLQEAGAREAFPPIVIKDDVTTATDQLCSEAGTDMGQWLTRDKSIKQMKSLDGDLDKALGRISGGLYIITAQKDEAASAMLASWVMQASSEPPGISIAVAKDRAIESLMRVGDRFVLNVLEEGNHLGLMKHFLKRFAPGADRFEGVKTQPASNGAPILAEALAYLECTVISRLETADHWVVYSTVDVGRVAKADARTAVHHRKVGNHY